MHAPLPDPYAPRARFAGPVHPPTTGERLGPLQWFARGGWYILVVVGSLGMLSFVPFLHAATRLRTPVGWLWVALYSAAVIWLFSLTGPDSDMGGLAIGLMIIAVVHTVVLRRQVWPATPAPQQAAPPAPVGVPYDPAVAAVLAARARREEARRLAATDPQMARELRIGRPDLPRAYDDGGLVDLNSAPPQAIADTCGIPADVAAGIAGFRSTGIAFSTVDDVLSCVEVPYPLWDRIRDRAVVIPG